MQKGMEPRDDYCVPRKSAGSLDHGLNEGGISKEGNTKSSLCLESQDTGYNDLKYKIKEGYGWIWLAGLRAKVRSIR